GILHSGRFVAGPAVDEFESKFARFCGTGFCVGTGSGTDALRFALMAIGVGSGDLVVTVPNTFIATSEAITQVGGWPAFVDIDPRTFTMCPDRLKEFFEHECIHSSNGEVHHRRTGLRVSAVVPVHLYGQTADMDAILEVAREYGCAVVEDACQAHGAEYYSRMTGRWMRAGEMGAAAAFSFYPGKNLGAFGEAGAVTTSNEEVAMRVRLLRDHGQKQKYVHLVEGYNGRLDAIQAAILTVKLGHLAKRNEQRRCAAERYSRFLSEITWLKPPVEPKWTRSVYHLYVVRTPNRENLRQYLLEGGIHTGLHYPIPLHRQPAYRWLGYQEGAFPESEKAAERILSLPMFPEITAGDQERVVARMMDFAEQNSTITGPVRVVSG
ncbi:MAG: erythromycin biosynthesis sensory transduction protein eryC1, partial [Chitinivibrionales bacterium]|nr:erythromycin biosynthesis sensory transduction protein eryC1 [Chitinivibrionales bacterium]MBD3358238.1 erythromycin biosynthesis sensory transduction protein eryC1 [Chitinivibrionales bacterium]